MQTEIYRKREIYCEKNNNI